MSGPYCESCRYFSPRPFGVAECLDPAKIIYQGRGDAINGAPETFAKCTCQNWTQAETTTCPDGEPRCTSTSHVFPSSCGAPLGFSRCQCGSISFLTEPDDVRERREKIERDNYVGLALQEEANRIAQWRC